MKSPYELRNTESGETFEIPVLKSEQGPNVLDIRQLYNQTGLFTYDPGFSSTASCDSSITYIDGDEGKLQHCGYSIEELAEHSTYLELCYLLLNGRLPSQKEYKLFRHDVTRHTMVHEQMTYFFRGFRRDAHPMAILSASMAALAAFYPNGFRTENPENHRISIYRLICKAPTLAAMAYKHTIGQPFIYPRNDLSYVGNFLHMCFAVPAEEYHVDPVVEAAMERIFILHADHEQNASTSTVRLAGSTGAPPFACISAGISALWGAAHGGANEAVLKMLKEIDRKENIPQYIERAKDPNDPYRLMGFGHRVYKNYDPRAGVLRDSCRDVLRVLAKEDEPLLDLAMELERISLADEYFIKRKLFPNVDFYSGIILNAIGFPVEMFTVLFAVSRVAGWVSQWKEMTEDKTSRIGRPRQRFTGEKLRPYVPISKR